MRYFFDTEFYERGHLHPIQLISLGIVAEDGRQFYVENADVDLASLSDWLKQNVVPYLREKDALVLPHAEIGPAVVKFVGGDVRPEFWAYFADYDWVLFCQLFGSMINMPESFPHFCRDLQQEKWRLGCEKPVIEGCGPAHNALADARWNRAFFDWMVEKRGLLLPLPPEVKPTPERAKVTVHILRAGLTLCRFTEKAPRDWPDDQKWAHTVVELKNLSSPEVPCMECVRVERLGKQRVP